MTGPERPFYMEQSAAQLLGTMRDLVNGQARQGTGLPSFHLPSVNGVNTPGSYDDPVFVLCMARSGSTLLRFLLDAHHDLACPPETDLAALCSKLAETWCLLAGSPLQKDRDGKTQAIPEPVLTGIQHTVTRMMTQYLARRAKKRYCDKSMYTARYADLLLRLFPGARFICLYRHPMDMIASGIESCPWGLKGFGFDDYAAGSPNNAVLALARFWSDHAAEIMAVEERYPDRCRRVRYEDLVTDPEGVADGIFSFLGVPSLPGIAASCFAPERERYGRGDYKIWQTSQITAASVGRGWSIPASLIEPGVTATVNRLADKLGYVRVDEKWSVADTPPDLRLSATGTQTANAPTASAIGTRQMPRAYLLIGELLQAGLFRVSSRFARRWEPCIAESFLVIATSPSGDGGSAKWRVDLTGRTVTLADGIQAGTGGAVSWQITGGADTWERVIRGAGNLNVALRRRDLRYCDTGTAAPTAAVTRMGMLADLLGVTSWRSADGATKAPASSAA